LNYKCRRRLYNKRAYLYLHIISNNTLPPNNCIYIVSRILYKYYIYYYCMRPVSANNNFVLCVASLVRKSTPSSSSADEMRIAIVAKKKKNGADWAPCCRSTGPQPLAVFEINNRRGRRVFHKQPHSITPLCPKRFISQPLSCWDSFFSLLPSVYKYRYLFKYIFYPYTVFVLCLNYYNRIITRYHIYHN
jgi:hypothetical protein